MSEPNTCKTCGHPPHIGTCGAYVDSEHPCYGLPDCACKVSSPLAAIIEHTKAVIAKTLSSIKPRPFEVAFEPFDPTQPGVIKGTIRCWFEPPIGTVTLPLGFEVTITHAFYQDPSPRAPGQCDYTFPDGDYCGRPRHEHTSDCCLEED